MLTALSGIRRVLGDDALLVERENVQLRPGCLQTDFDQLKSPAQSGADIGNLAAFYGGDFLQSAEYDGVQFMELLRGMQRDSAELAIDILDKNAQNLTARGDNEAAIERMLESLSLEPLMEQTHRKIMRLYVENGERAMALAQFKTCKEVLLHELDTVPDPETQALADTIALRDTSVLAELRPAERSVPMAANLAEPQGAEAAPIAVLPFVNMSGDAEQNYFADGIAEDIIIDLSDIDMLAVAAKNSRVRTHNQNNTIEARIMAERKS
ncbi:MAG: hypothetical protein JKX69_15430, partial [Rhodobacteraceae bacterium]|nr:hypothetical protein [Paracoccaceae bacterium]